MHFSCYKFIGFDFIRLAFVLIYSAFLIWSKNGKMLSMLSFIDNFIVLKANFIKVEFENFWNVGIGS